MSQKYVPSVNYGSRAKTRSRRMELLKYVGRDIVLHYKDGRTERVKVYSYEGPYLLLLAPKSSLGHIGIEIDKWDIREEKGELHAYSNHQTQAIAPESHPPVQSAGQQQEASAVQAPSSSPQTG